MRHDDATEGRMTHKRMTQNGPTEKGPTENGTARNGTIRRHAPRDILLPWMHAGSERGPLRAALALAEAFDAHVRILATVDVPMPMPTDWGGMSYDLYARIHEDAYARNAALVARLRQAHAPEGARVEVRSTESIVMHPAATAAMHARYADLAVVPTAPVEDAQSGLALSGFGELLIHGGRPVLAVPESADIVGLPKRALIAWKPTAQAARAVHDALPLLRDADIVEVLVIDAEIDARSHGEEPGADIAAHLARHGLDVEVTTRPSMDFSVAREIVKHARRTGAQLIVAGGYGHSRLREFALGGATRELMQYTDVPILFSH